jgi:hypothetical protein
MASGKMIKVGAIIFGSLPIVEYAAKEVRDA